MDDTTQIIQVLNTYALGVDSQRWELFDLVFTADCDVRCAPGLHWTDLASFKQDFAFLHKPLDASMHIMTNHLVTVDGDTAQASVYGSWRLMRQAGVGGRDYWESGGWYEDELVRTPKGWRISKRVIRNTWWDGNPLSLPPMPAQSPAWQEGMEAALASMCKRGPAGELPMVEALLRT